MGFNLNTAQGFASAVSGNLSGAASLLNNLLGGNTWNIQEAAYGVNPNSLVVFHVFSNNNAPQVSLDGVNFGNPSVDYDAAVDRVQDKISRRVPEYRFPYVDGQATDDLGKEGSSYEFNAIIFGPNYASAYAMLLAEFDKPEQGYLRHPVLGILSVKFKSATVTYQSSVRQAVTLQLEFVDSNVDVSFSIATLSSLKAALSKAVTFISNIAGIITAIQGEAAVVQSTVAAVVAQINSFSALYTDFLVALNTSFNSGTSADIPALLPASPATGTQSSTFQTATPTTGVYAGITPAQTQSLQSATITIQQAQVQLTSLAQSAQVTLNSIESINNGQGSLLFYSQTNIIRQSVIAAKNALIQAIQTSNQTLTNYTTPRLMSIREVCFANGLTPDQSQDVLTQNPFLESVNYIPAGTMLEIPSA